MSKAEETLIDKVITLYLDGGWEVSGLVKSVSDGKIVLEQEHTGGLFLVFREKVSCLQLQGKRTRAPNESPGVKNVAKEVGKEVEKDDYGFPMNDIGYSDSGMSIPRGMLENLPEEDPDLSVTFGGDAEREDNDGRGQIDFRIDDDSKKED
jgi:hypothetical protein